MGGRVMADELKMPLDPFTDTGLTLLGKVYNSTGAQEGSTVAMSEDGPALYIGDFDVSARSDGQYIVRFETNTPDKLYGTGSLYIRDGKEVSPEMYFNQALDTVSNVTLVATTTTNTDMRGTDSANTVAPDNAGITANGNAIAALNNFNPSVDQVTVSTNNDKAGYSISGTKTTLDALNDISASDVYIEFTNGSNEDVFKADVSGLSTQASVDAIDGNIDAILVDTGITIPNQISSLNDFDPASDTVANVTNVANNADMRGTDGANTVAPDNTGISANATNIEELRANQVAFNEGVKKSSLIIPYSSSLPNA